MARGPKLNSRNKKLERRDEIKGHKNLTDRHPRV